MYKKYVKIMLCFGTVILSAHTQATAVFLWFGANSIWSLRVADAIPPAGPIAGGVKIVTAIVDPDISTLKSGRVTLNYNPEKLSLD